MRTILLKLDCSSGKRVRPFLSKNLGWALWNLRGSFGILDSGRGDVAYEDYNGHKLDRTMLELLRRY